MALEANNPGIIDHQDIMLGPLSYDLVSLLKDCYIDWPDHKVKQWVNYYLENSEYNYNYNDFVNNFALTGLQRHLKALGIFTRQAHLYNNKNYLQYLPRVLKYIQSVVDINPNLNGLAKLLKKL